LPVVFVCENNLYSAYSPLTVRQPASRDVVRLAEGHGVESHQGDGNDVVEVCRLAKRAVQKAREGGGPSFLELKTYRWREHCGPNYDNDFGYRPEIEFLEWKARCPIARLKEQFFKNGLVSAEELEHMVVSLKAEIDGAVAFAEQSPVPGEEVLLQGVFAP
jgi:pyruvate dehydrogenase E1 component alpha subunit